MRILFFTAVLATVAFAATTEQQILEAEKSWANAVMTGDFAKVDALLTPDIIYAHSTGIIDTKSSYMEKLRSGKQKYDGIEHKSTTVRVHGDSVVTHSQMRMHGTNAAGKFDDKVMMMHVWVKSGGKWLLAAHQTTKLP